MLKPPSLSFGYCLLSPVLVAASSPFRVVHSLKIHTHTHNHTHKHSHKHTHKHTHNHTHTHLPSHSLFAPISPSLPLRPPPPSPRELAVSPCMSDAFSHTQHTQHTQHTLAQNDTTKQWGARAKQIAKDGGSWVHEQDTMNEEDSKQNFENNMGKREVSGEQGTRRERGRREREEREEEKSGRE